MTSITSNITSIYKQIAFLIVRCGWIVKLTPFLNSFGVHLVFECLLITIFFVPEDPFEKADLASHGIYPLTELKKKQNIINSQIPNKYLQIAFSFEQPTVVKRIIRVKRVSICTLGE